ncbi:MAG: serine/threonine-protein phosphatase [Candidatus Promineofilum sp.]|nr:serine/threonine-protein phosphatase [Promineifilum sp.]
MDEQPSLPTIALSAEASAGRLAVRAAARTHPGRVRDLNEDSVILISLSGLLAGTAAPSRGPELGFFAVADGMGGHDRGEVASRRVAQQLAAAVLDRVFKRVVLTGRGADEAWMARVLRDCILAANAELLAAQRANHSDMGTTLTAALVIDGRATVANVGDSRTYLWRDDTLAQITRDHSLVASLVAAGALEPEAVYTHEQKAMIYRSIGEADDLTVDTFNLSLRPGDRLLLCSDGLWEMVRDEGLAAALRAAADPQAVCDRLLDEANQAGGEDNISVLVVWVAPMAIP